MPEPGEQAVSTPPGGSGQPSGHAAPTPPTPPPATPPAGGTPPPPPEPKKEGFDALPEYGKEIIQRQTAKAKAAEDRATRAEAELAKHMQPKEDELDADTRASVQEFGRLAQLAGYKSEAEINEIVQSRLGDISRKEAENADRAELQSVLTKYDGAQAPKVMELEILNFLQKCEGDPRLSYMLNAPFEDVVRKMKETEVRQFEVDQILKKGGTPPTPPIEKGDGTRTPTTGVKRYGTAAEMRMDLERKFSANRK